MHHACCSRTLRGRVGRLLAGVLLAGLAGVPAAGGELELSAWVGRTLPFYSQDFSYEPPVVPSLPGVSVQQQGAFQFEAKGGLALGAGLAWHGGGPLGIELRLDSGAVEVEQEGASLTASVRPPAPLPPISIDVAARGTATLGRLLPVSLDLRYRSAGKVGVVASAGVSYLPSFDFTLTQQIGLGASVGGGGLGLPTLPLEAGGSIDGFWGLNAGLGLRVRLGGAVSAVVEGRGFFFGEREIEWRVDRFPISPALGESLRQQLGPIRFTPGFFQATAGLALSF